MRTPPVTARRPVEETLHGDTIVDPYRWLEEDSEERRAWIAAQNAHTRAELDGWPGRAPLRQRLDELMTVGSIGVPVPRGERVFYGRRDGRQDQAVLRVREADRERILVDPNRADSAGLVSLDWWTPSPDGRRLAYGLSRGGDEWSELKVLDVDTGADLGISIPRCRAASIAWLPDGSGFYYTRYPTPGTVPPEELSYHRHVFLHRYGRPWQEDPVVWGPGRDATEWASLALSPDGRWLAVFCYFGWSRADVYVRAEPGGPWRTVIEGVEALSQGEIVGDTLWMTTTLDAPTRRIVAVDLHHPEPSGWREVVAARPDAVIEHFAIVRDTLAISTLESASSRLRLYGTDGALRAEVPLPELGSISGVSGEPDGSEIYALYSSFVRPPTAWRIDRDGNLATFASGTAPSGFQPSRYVARQEWYASKDGTKIPMFLIHRADLAMDGDRPTVLSGYGGFGISRTPAFSALLTHWLDAGGVYAVANLRGGGEFGEAWHQAGMLANKQNVYDDFLAACDYLATSGITKPARLGIVGGSNGGLLVGAALVQRPEAFAAVVCAVPLLDMLRYHRFRLARLWIAEYGDPEDPVAYRWLEAYSPYHHVRDGVPYPAVLLETGAEDSRVDPMHALKMAAHLQAATTGGPVLLRVEEAAGHGAGKPRSKQVEEAADTWGFLARHLGLPQASPDGESDAEGEFAR